MGSIIIKTVHLLRQLKQKKSWDERDILRTYLIHLSNQTQKNGLDFGTNRKRCAYLRRLWHFRRTNLQHGMGMYNLRHRARGSCRDTCSMCVTKRNLVIKQASNIIVIIINIITSCRCSHVHHKLCNRNVVCILNVYVWCESNKLDFEFVIAN